MEVNKTTIVEKTVKSGVTFGSALAMVISYTTWKSIGWAIFHGLLSWVYVIYFILRYLTEVYQMNTIVWILIGIAILCAGIAIYSGTKKRK